MSSNFMDRQQSHEALYDYIITKEWWMFMSTFHNEGGLDALIEIEKTYYTPGTPLNGDFHLIVYPPFGTISFAKKSRMSAKQLGKIMGKPAFDDRDIIILSSSDSDTELERTFYNEVISGYETVKQIKREEGV